MLLCQNGWPVIEAASGVGRYTIPGTPYQVTARPGDTSVILLDWLGFIHHQVEPLLVPGVWGWAVRPVRGQSSGYSNHAGGDAVDASAPRHPLGTGLDTWKPSPQSVQRIRRRLLSYTAVAPGTFRWGGDYSGRLDTMHGECLGTVASRRVLADAIRGHRLPGGEVSYLVGAPAPVITPPHLDSLSYGLMHDARVAALQKFLNAYNWEPPLPLLPITGNFLDQTKAVVEGAQRQCAVGVDGIVGPQTSAAFAARGARW